MGSELRKKSVIALTTIAVLAAIVGVYRAIHSPLFTVQVVEVADQVSLSQAAPQNTWTPVDPQTISDLAAVPVGQANLFDLDLSRVEKRILTNEWIREVKLQKRFPQTLSITTIFREPKAIVQLETGALAYVDLDGKVFGKVSLEGPKNLALITGVDSDNPERLKGLLQVLKDWETAPVSKFARIESLSFDEERGYRLMISYPAENRLVHTRVDLGRESADFAHLAQVFDYLHGHSVIARQIFADTGKKIVVKTAHGS